MMKKLLIFVCSLLVFASVAQNPTEDILRRAEVMPVFQECQNERYAQAPYSCTLQQLSDYFKGLEVVDNPSGQLTKCALSLVVEKDGSVSDVKIDRGVFVAANSTEEKELIEEKINNAIIKKAKDLKFMSPAYQNGQKVRVRIQFSAGVNY